MPTLKLGVVLRKQMEAHNAVSVRISHRDVISPRTHFGQIHKTLLQPKQNVRLATVRLQPDRNGKIWSGTHRQSVKQLVQLLACLNLGWRLTL
jgi:hypothetical protein